MTAATARTIDALTPAWRELETRSHVKLRAIENDQHYRAMADFMNQLLDEISDSKAHPLAGLLDIVASFVRDYEERNVEIPNAAMSDVLTKSDLLQLENSLIKWLVVTSLAVTVLTFTIARFVKIGG